MSLGKNKTQVLERRKLYVERDELASKMHRKWQGGDVYAPHDLSYQEQKKWIKPKQPSKDVIDMLGLNPLDHYKVRGWSWRWSGLGLSTIYDVVARAHWKKRGGRDVVFLGY